MRNNSLKKVLVIGASGSVGKHVIDVALQQGLEVRAFVRSKSSAHQIPEAIELVIGDFAHEADLKSAVKGVDAIVFTHGTYGSLKTAEAVDYGVVRNVLGALEGQRQRIALMTTIGATDRKGAHDWKRRAEWLVRAGGHAYTIVRPAWFDCNAPDEHQLLMLQGDKSLVGSPKDGVIARRQLAEVLVRSLYSKEAIGKTFELHAIKGSAQSNFDPLFFKLDSDRPGSIHGIHDIQNMPLEDEPQNIRMDIQNAQSAASIVQALEFHHD